MQISEIFHSLQGEGLLIGLPSAFIRTAGCNLACEWCDTRHARSADDGRSMTVDAILGEVARWPQTRHCVVTGGEPTLQPELAVLTARLRDAGKHVTIETNATNPPAAGLHCDLASLSPKLRHAGTATPPVNKDVLRHWMARGAYQLKLVCAGAGDLTEIGVLCDTLREHLDPNRVLLMPLTVAGEKAEAVQARRDAVVAICLARGFRYAPRLHIELFGGRRGA